MSNDDLTIEILKQIRDGVTDVRSELKETRTDLGARIDATNERLDTTNERLDSVVREQIRHATAIVGLEQRMGGVEQGVGALDKRLMGMDMRLTSLEQTFVTEIRKLGDRIDNVLTGQLGQVVRSTSARVDALEARMDRVEGR